MGNILVLFASTSGNTEMMAEIIADSLIDKNHQVVVKMLGFDTVNVDDVADYEAVLVGTHTWDDGALPYEVEDFYDDLADVDIKGKIFGVFGSADSFYHTYGGAIDLVGDHVEELGAELLPERLKIDLEPDESGILRCLEFAEMASIAIAAKHVRID